VTYDDGFVQIHNGNALDVMASLPAESVDCCVTSPPYWGLRKYDGAGENPYGLEPTPELYVQHTLDFLRAIRRVLKDSGTVWWNIGDSYAGSGKGQMASGEHATKHGEKQHTNKGTLCGGLGTDYGDLKPKDLCLIPFRVALAAQADGWWVRSVIIWAKANPMPESVRDRPTESHEYILMLTKKGTYYFDQEAVREPHIGGLQGGRQYAQAKGLKREKRNENGQPSGQGHNMYALDNPNGRNIRTVWNINTEPYPEAHFATFPTEIPKRCILAGTSEKGVCEKCGKPWERMIQKGLTAHDGATDCSYEKGTTANRLALLRQAARQRGGEYANEAKTLGWQPTCKCGGPTIPATVLDPFSGSGTTGMVAKQLGRKGILIDTSAKYCELARKRVGGVPLPMPL